MDTFVWRYSARVVAYVDLILAVALLALIVNATVKARILISRIKNQSMQENKNAIARAKLFGLVLAAIMNGVDLWAALKLLSATEVEEAVGEALAKSRIWWNANVFLLVVVAIIRVIHICNTRGTEATVIWIISRIISFVISFLSMFIVFEFIQELEMVAT